MTVFVRGCLKTKETKNKKKERKREKQIQRNIDSQFIISVCYKSKFYLVDSIQINKTDSKLANMCSCVCAHVCDIIS